LPGKICGYLSRPPRPWLIYSSGAPMRTLSDLLAGGDDVVLEQFILRRVEIGPGGALGVGNG